jgi:WD40 repeat protein
MFTAGRDGAIISWDSSFELVHKAHAAHADWINALAVSPDATVLASGGNDFVVKLWFISGVLEPVPSHVLCGHVGGVVSLAFMGEDLVSGR